MNLRKLLGHDDKFFDLLESSARQAQSSVQLLVTTLKNPETTPSLDEFVQARRKDKKITEEITEELCKTFVTPLEREDIEAWLEFFLTVSLEQARQAIELLSHENIEKILSPKQLTVWRYLETVEEATAGDVAKATGVARPTVSQAIDVLLRLKKIERIGQGRTTRYQKV